MSEFVDVASLEELVPGVPKAVELEGRSIVVVSWEGEVHAVRNLCPHQSTPLVLGSVRASVVAGDRIGEVCHDRGRPVIACPWHAWAFDLHDGHCQVDRQLRIKVYPTRVENGRVLVAVRT